MVPGAQASLLRGIPKHGQGILASWLEPLGLGEVFQRRIAQRLAARECNRLLRPDTQGRRGAGDILKNFGTGTRVADGQLAGEPGLPIRQEILHAVLVVIGPGGHLQHGRLALVTFRNVHPVQSTYRGRKDHRPWHGAGDQFLATTKVCQADPCAGSSIKAESQVGIAQSERRLIGHRPGTASYDHGHNDTLPPQHGTPRFHRPEPGSPCFHWFRRAGPHERLLHQQILVGADRQGLAFTDSHGQSSLSLCPYERHGNHPAPRARRQVPGVLWRNGATREWRRTPASRSHFATRTSFPPPGGSRSSSRAPLAADHVPDFASKASRLPGPTRTTVASAL